MDPPPSFCECVSYGKMWRMLLQPRGCITGITIIWLVGWLVSGAPTLGSGKLGPSQIRIVHVRPEKNGYHTNSDRKPYK